MPFKSYMNQVCPAKVNLILRVGGIRRDGYHELESLMVRTTWGDRLSLQVRRASATQISLRTPGLKLNPEKNLVYRAALAFANEFKTTFEARILLKKIVPTGAGLGGGSSDAAKTLELLYRWKFGKKTSARSRLLRVAAKLGADVPFFLGASAAWCTGIGEKMEGLEIPKLWIVLFLPQVRVETPWAYRELDRSRSKQRRQRYLFGKPGWFFETYDIPELHNDFEAPVTEAKPALAGMKRWLAESGAIATGMSGSGAAFFGLYSSKREATRACIWLRNQGLRAIATASA